MPDPAADLIAVADVLRPVAHRCPAVATFVDGIDRWREGRAPDLDAAFGLEGAQGIRSGRWRMWKSEQYRHLRRASELLADEPGSPSAALARQVGKFESDIWPRWRDLVEPPAGSSELRRELFAARKLGRVPMSARQLLEIIGPFGREPGAG